MSWMRNAIIALLLTLTTLSAAQSIPEGRLMRFPDVYKDKIAFSYGGDIWLVAKDGGVARRVTSLSGCRHGKGRNSAGYRAEKIAVLAPIARANVMTATAVKPRLLRSMRSPYRKSCFRVPMVYKLDLPGLVVTGESPLMHFLVLPVPLHFCGAFKS